MTWPHRYQLQRAFRTSLWHMPVLAIGLAMVMAAAAPLDRSPDRLALLRLLPRRVRG